MCGAADSEWDKIKVQFLSQVHEMCPGRCADSKRCGWDVPKAEWAEPGLRQHHCVRAHTTSQYLGLEGTCESPSTTPLH